MKTHWPPKRASSQLGLLALLIGSLVTLATAAQIHNATSTSPGNVPESSTTFRSTPTTTTSTSGPGPETTPKLALETSTNAVTTNDPEPVTSIAAETIGANTDESERLTGDHSTGGGDDDETSADPRNADELPGIEGKSISHAASDNSVASETSGKLTVDPAAAAEAASEGGESEEAEEVEMKPEKKYKASAATRINMTEIDEIYMTGRRDESETVEAWHRMAKKLKKGISGVIGAIVPYALNMSQEAKISSNCSGAMLKWVLSMNQLKAWALRMLDASGKPIAGLLEGSMTMFGNYRQCLKLRAPDDDEIEFAGEFREYFRGKYCIIQAKPWLPPKDRFYNLNAKLASLASESEPGAEDQNAWYDRTIFEELSEWLLAFNFVNIRYDLCVPSLCSRLDIQRAINYLTQNLDLKARVLRCEMDLPDGKLGVAAQVETGASEVADALALVAAASTSAESINRTLISDGNHMLFDLRSFSQLGWIVLPLVALVLVVVATLLSLTIGDDAQEEEDEATMLQSSSELSGKPKRGGRGGRGKLKHTIKSLSLKRSIGSHLNVDYEQLADDKPLALYGIRFLLVLWVILVESSVNLKFEYLRELMMLKDLIFWWPLQFIINSTMQYDSFILLTAFTMGYKNCLNEGVNNAKALTRFVVDKYVRLMPSIMVMVAMVILLPLVYRGPVWNDYVTKQSAVCQSTGWLNTIFLQNYLPYGEICLPQTWLLCVELQLVLIMAPIVYYLSKSYSSNYGNSAASCASSRRQDTTGGSKATALALDNSPPSTSCSEDSSKPFHWLWTKPGLLLAGCVALGLASSFYNVFVRQLPPSWFYTMADPDSKALYFGEHMTKLWAHLAVFAMGLLAGVECRRATKNVQRVDGYRGANLDFMVTVAAAAHHNHPLAGHQKSQSGSAASLPTIVMAAGQSQGQNGSASSDTSSDHWTASSQHRLANGGGLGGGGSSVSINFNQANTTTTNTAASSANGEFAPAAAARPRGVCAAMLDLLGYLVAITIMAAIIFSTHDWSLNDLPRPLIAALFDSTSRLLWSLAMIWILYKVSVPHQDRSFSCLARLLGHPVLVCLGKLSFLIYIIHPFVHTTVLAIQEQPIYSSWLMMFHILIGNITITVILASLVSLFVEMPCRNLFRRCGTSLLLAQSVDAGAAAVADRSTKLGGAGGGGSTTTSTTGGL